MTICMKCQYRSQCVLFKPFFSYYLHLCDGVLLAQGRIHTDTSKLVFSHYFDGDPEHPVYVYRTYAV